MDLSKLLDPNIPTLKSLPDIVSEINTIDDDFAIFDKLDDVLLMDYPSRLDVAIFALCLKGSCRLGINLEEYTLEQGQMFIAMPDQIIQCFKMSDDFSGAYIVFSKNFIDGVVPRLHEILPLFFYINTHPCITLTSEQLDSLLEYHSFLWKKVRASYNLYRREVVRGLFLSMIYEMYNFCSPYFAAEEGRNKPRQQEIFEDFLKEVSLSYKKERGVNFYARKLCITPKHLPWAVKEVSGKTAGTWIDESVILEAKTLLKSSDMNIQQISEELNFANQSFFGKYFKHYTGMSPKEYRKK